MNPVDAEVRAVFFDAVGTLIFPRLPVAEAYAQAGRKFGHDLSGESIQYRFRIAFQAEEKKDAEADWVASEERELRRWQSIVGSVFQVENERLFHYLWERFARSTAWRLAPDAGEVLEKLSRKGLLLGLASNFDRRLHPVVEGFPELAPLQVKLISSEVGYRKPSPRFFRAVLDAARCEPRQILFVGDDRLNDYDAAIAAGMHAVLFDQRQRLRDLL
jgi:putative hydrolase of the HAD superfamily